MSRLFCFCFLFQLLVVQSLLALIPRFGELSVCVIDFPGGNAEIRAASHYGKRLCGGSGSVRLRCRARISLKRLKCDRPSLV